MNPKNGRLRGIYFDHSDKEYDLELIICNLKSDKIEIKFENEKYFLNIHKLYYQKLSNRNLEDHKGYAHINIILTSRLDLFEQADYEDLKRMADGSKTNNL